MTLHDRGPLLSSPASTPQRSEPTAFPIPIRPSLRLGWGGSVRPPCGWMEDVSPWRFLSTMVACPVATRSAFGGDIQEAMTR